MICKKCRVRAPYAMGTPTMNQLCIKCYYQESENINYMCPYEGCLKAVAEIEEKILNGQVGPPEIASTGVASSSRDDQARNSQQTIQALKDDVAQLKETVRGM